MTQPLRYMFVPAYVDELQVCTLEDASKRWPNAKYIIRVDIQSGDADTYIMPVEHKKKAHLSVSPKFGRSG